MVQLIDDDDVVDQPLDFKEGPLVVIVGAGVSGLITLKSCLEQGLNAVCYEQSDGIGGLWQFKEDAISCMKTTLFNTSKEWSAFSDFPMPGNFPNYLNYRYYTQYLHMFADKFDLHHRIRLNHIVVRVHRSPSYQQTGEWIVNVKNKKNNKDEELVASKVAMCAGVFLQPNNPLISGLEEFQGKVIHSMTFKSTKEMENKKVIVIGSGNTAVDAAVEIGRVASKVYLAIRQGVVVLGRLGHMGYPIDMQIFKRLPIMIKAARKDPFKEIFLDSWYKTQSLQVDKTMYQFSTKGFSGRVPVVINDELPLNVVNGNVVLKNPVRHFTSTGVVFEGEDEIYDADAVILSTGYRVPDKGILDDPAVSKDHIYHGLYKRVFPAHLPHPTLAFIGYVRVHGPNAQIIELQARWAAQVFDKKVKLPPQEVMEHFLAKENEKDGTEKASEHTLLRDYYPFADQLAEEFGAKPNLYRLFFYDFRLFCAVCFGPMLPYHYRLNGPHSWDGARQAIFTVDHRIRQAFKTKPENRLQNYYYNTFCNVVQWPFLTCAAALGLFTAATNLQLIHSVLSIIHK